MAVAGSGLPEAGVTRTSPETSSTIPAGSGGASRHRAAETTVSIRRPPGRARSVPHDDRVQVHGPHAAQLYRHGLAAAEAGALLGRQVLEGGGADQDLGLEGLVLRFDAGRRVDGVAD